jgi:menaquinone-dependent protoporphyrinogen oxidase
MQPRILIAYASKHGSTHEVADQVADVLRDDGLDVDVLAASAVRELDAYRAVVIGGALYMGRWHRDARHLLHGRRSTLASLPVFVYAMGPTETDADAVASARKQLDHALRAVPEVQPVAVAVFGGVVDPDDFHFPLNHMPAADALDRGAVRAWASDVASTLKADRAQATPL